MVLRVLGQILFAKSQSMALKQRVLNDDVSGSLNVYCLSLKLKVHGFVKLKVEDDAC